MYAHELRLGNWVLVENKYPMQVISVGYDAVYLDFDGNDGDYWCKRAEDLTPIEINEDILYACGILPSGVGSYFGENLWAIKSEDCDSWEFVINKDFHNKRVCELSITLKNLHELQNAYYLITSEELQFNL